MGGAMNKKQKTVLGLLALIILLMMLFPPFSIEVRGITHNKGYSFILSPPKLGGLITSVNSEMLVVQWIGALILGGIVFLFFRGGKPSPSKAVDENKMVSSAPDEFQSVDDAPKVVDDIPHSAEKNFKSANAALMNVEEVSQPVAEITPGQRSIMLVLLRIIRAFCGFLFAWQILGLLPVLTWLRQPDAVTGDMLAILLIKALALALFGQFRSCSTD